MEKIFANTLLIHPVEAIFELNPTPLSRQRNARVLSVWIHLARPSIAPSTHPSYAIGLGN
ncbi:MAG: hypothetical protein ACK5PZ_09405 [Pirellula sp.]